MGTGVNYLSMEETVVDVLEFALKVEVSKLGEQLIGCRFDLRKFSLVKLGYVHPRQGRPQATERRCEFRPKLLGSQRLFTSAMVLRQ